MAAPRPPTTHGRALGVLAASLLSGLWSTAAAQTRTFPDTRDGIRVFADQIPPGNTEAQNRFAARSYVGTQKMIRDDIRAIRAHNPDFLHLHYKLAVGQGDSTTYIINGNEWITDWDYVNQQEDWFFTDEQGTRIRHTTWGWYLMDVSGQISGAGNDGWKEYWADSGIAQARNNEADGLFADSYDVAVVNAIYLDPPYWWFQGTQPATTWVPHLDLFGAYLADRLHAEPERFYLLPNLGLQVTSWDPADYAFGDGGMIEGFAQWGGDDPFDLYDWKLQMNRLLALIEQDKILILQSYLNDPLDVDDRLFYIGCLLLIKGHHTYVNILAHGPGLDMQYYPEYTLDLGPYVAEPPPEIDDLLDSGWGVYRREYERGQVLVNPSDTARQVTLAAPAYLVTATGGGVVDAAGQYHGTLTYALVNEVTLGPAEAVVLLDAPPQPEAQAADLAAAHRHGQTFLTWSEVEEVGEIYRLYRHDEPITPANLAAAERIAEIAEGSAFYANEASRPSPLQHNFIIEDLGPELPDGTGLLVWTPHEDAPAYYAVTAVVGGLENAEITAENSLPDPVAETDAPPRPVLVWAASTGRGWVFTQFMDYAAWNPTYEGYAFNYGIGVPTNYDGQTPFPLTIYLDGWGERYDALTTSPYDYQTIFLSVDEPHQTWYYGHAADHDYDTGGSTPTTGRIANFTEWRILRSIFDAIADERFNVDEQRIYVYGGSMGGSGTIALAMRYPDLFAAAYSAAGMTDYATAGTYGGLNWESDLAPKWGAIADNLPSVSLGPYAQHLVPYDDIGVWDWMDHQEGMRARTADEMTYLATAHGDADDIIEWQSQGAPWYPLMAGEARRGFSGMVVAGGGHFWYGFGGCGNNLPFESYVFRRDRSFPGLTDCSLNSTTSYNRAVEWSCPWYDFAGDIVDEPDRYEIVLRVAQSGSLPFSGTVDVTPRNLQAFEAVPGRAYTWRNETLGGAVGAEGAGAVDALGLILIDDLEITKDGNRLVIEAESTGTGEPSTWPAPAAVLLRQPQPNPSRGGAVRLRFALPDDMTAAELAEVRLAIIDVHGRQVACPVAGVARAGWHEAEWDGDRRLPAGIYWARLQTPRGCDAREIVRLD